MGASLGILQRSRACKDFAGQTERLGGSRHRIVTLGSRLDGFSTPRNTTSSLRETVLTVAQVMLRRVLVCSRPVVPSATPSRLAAATRSDPLCTACSAATPAPSTVTRTRMPTSRRVSSGRRTLWYVEALNATSPQAALTFDTDTTNVALSPTVRVPREPQEVHPRHQDGLRWPEEGEGQERPDHVRLGDPPIPPSRSC